MFQYAVARKLAHDHNTSVYLDLVSYENQAACDTARGYELNCFNLKANLLPSSRRPIESEEIYNNKYGRLLRIKHLLQKKNLNIYHEPHHQYDNTVANLDDNSYLIGYWQSEKYFSDIRNILLKDFSFTKPATGKNATLLKDILASESISLHVRRGDYVSNAATNKFHGTKDNDYYHKALSIITSKTKNPIIFVFSDDPKWCKQNLKFDQKTIYVDGNVNGFEDMRLMMNCKHNIIANSSFSWWAAWLNQNPNKIVVAPLVWFNDSSINTKDVIPKTWIKI
jgi:hypothetical protein